MSRNFDSYELLNDSFFVAIFATIYSCRKQLQIQYCLFENKINKGPFKNYVILLGGGGEVTKRLHKITMGEGGYTKRLHWITWGGCQFGHTIAKAKNQRNPDFKY